MSKNGKVTSAKAKQVQKDAERVRKIKEQIKKLSKELHEIDTKNNFLRYLGRDSLNDLTEEEQIQLGEDTETIIYATHSIL